MTFAAMFFQAIKARRLQWFTYCAIGLGFLLLYVAIFPSIESQTANYDEIFKTLPKGLIAALNITNDQASLLGYLSSKHFGLIWLLLIILFVISYGSFAIAKEIESKTMGLLLAQPVSRTTLYVARLIAGIVGLGLFVLTTELIVWPLAVFMNFEINAMQIVLIGASGFLFGLAVLCVSLMFSAFVSTGSKASALSSGVLLIMYALFLTASLSPDYDWLRYLSLFHYFAPGDIVTTTSLAWQSIVVFCSVSIVTAFVGLARFNKREVNV